MKIAWSIILAFFGVIAIGCGDAGQSVLAADQDELSKYVSVNPAPPLGELPDASDAEGYDEE